MRHFIQKVVIYLAAVLLISSVVIYIAINCWPQFFLMSPIDYALCTPQYSVINQKTAFRNIVIGDSRANAALLPKKLGPSWINLAIPGGDYYDGYITTRHYLLNNSIDTLIIMYGLDYIEGESPWFDQRTIPSKFPNYQELSGLYKIEKLFSRSIHVEENETGFGLLCNHIQTVLKYVHFPLSYRATFFDGLSSIIDCRDAKKRSLDSIENEISANLGQINFGHADSCSYLSIKDFNKQFSPDLVAETYLDSILNIAQKNKTVVFFAVPPLNQSTYIKFRNSRYELTTNLYLKTISDKHPLIHVCTIEGMPNTYFGDKFHLNIHGTQVYTSMMRGVLSGK